MSTTPKADIIEVPTRRGAHVKYVGNKVLTKGMARAIRGELRKAMQDLVWPLVRLETFESLPVQHESPGGVVWKGHLRTCHLVMAAYDILEDAYAILTEHINRRVADDDKEGEKE